MPFEQVTRDPTTIDCGSAEVRWQSVLGPRTFVEEVEDRFLRDRETGLTGVGGELSNKAV